MPTAPKKVKHLAIGDVVILNGQRHRVGWELIPWEDMLVFVTTIIGQDQTTLYYWLAWPNDEVMVETP